jgi:hypothetical protein
MENWEWRKLPTDERFHARYVVIDGDCWQWQGALTTRGYGMFWYCGKQICAHVAAYLLHKGDIPEGLEVDHLCGNKACVNPDHLEAVTHQVNVARGSLKRRRSHCWRGHPLEGDNVRIHRVQGTRYCVQCNRIRATEFYDKIRKGHKHA